MEVEIAIVSEGAANKQLLNAPSGSTIAEVLQLGKIILNSGQACGVFGEIKPLDYVVQEQDRIEIYSPLLQDPKHKRMVKVARSTLPRRCR